MTQTLKRAWAYLRACRRETVTGALAGFAMGMITLSHGDSITAHFFQKTTHQPPARTVVRNAPARSDITRRKPASSARSSAATRKPRVRPGARTATNLTDESLRAAAPAAASSSSITSAAQVRSSIAPVVRPAAPSESAPSPAPAPAPVPAAAPSVAESFPALERTVHPVSRVPNWGAMRTPEIWNRTYGEMTAGDFVPVPAYNLTKLTIPMSTLTSPITDDSIPLITAKLYYSTRPWGAYDVDAGEHSGSHDGVDLKLAIGTPVGAIGGGRVTGVERNETLGVHVLIEHRAGSERYVSVYGHLGEASVSVGEAVAPGDIVGIVGMTGNTSGPHLHLALHKAANGGDPRPYDMSQSVHPLQFIARYRSGE